MPQHRNFSSSKIEIFYLVNIGIGIGSVSADMKKRISVIYRIGRLKKWHLLVHIGIGRYEKNLIGRTLDVTKGADQANIWMKNEYS